MSAYDERPELAPGEALPPEREAELAEALRAAFAPAPLSSERHAELLASALEDPFAPASAEEIRESERLRRALDEGDDTHEGAALARALRAALQPEELRAPAEAHARAGVAASASKASGRGNVVYASFGALALAAAAAFALLLTREPEPEASKTAASPRPALLQSRTTGPLFQEPFEAGQTSARVDRIALARSRELRENQYALWGLR
ncbi:MAG TPA: hypothetical protein VGK73_12945 [Polyangiaceae bacterium]